MSDDYELIYRSIEELSVEEREVIQVICQTKYSNILNCRVCLKKQSGYTSDELKAEWFVWTEEGNLYDIFTVIDRHSFYEVRSSDSHDRWSRISKSKLKIS